MSTSLEKVIILAAPSGAGKTTITQYLLKRFPRLAFSISATTRAPRGAEQDGVEYHFLSLAKFEGLIYENAFLEYEQVYEGVYYGTLKSELARIWALGKVPVLDIDVKGAIHVQQQYPSQSFSLFIEPPSLDELKKRLESRGTETEASIQMRVGKAAFEISFKDHFNQVIINDKLEDACMAAARAIRNFLETKQYIIP